MALGYEVNKGVLDMKVAMAALSIRQSFENVASIATWLENHPINGSNDPLTSDPFDYTPAEASTLRTYFSTLNNLHTTNSSTFELGSQMSGLE